MQVRCKMQLLSIKTYQYGREFEFTAVCDDGTPENRKFNRASPSGKFTITVNNPNVNYEVGKYYYFESTPCESEA